MTRDANSRANCRSFVTGTVLLAAVLLLPSEAAAYSGSLSSENMGIVGTGHWIETGPTTIEWSVTENGDGTWHYEYTFTHPIGETSHLILETCGNFTEIDIFNMSGDFGPIEIQLHHVYPGNPSMPEDIYGIKFDDSWGLSTHIEFDSTRLPMWGDFYSKDGTAGGAGMNAAWNAGFTTPDWDPEAPAQDGSVENHLLVPDTHYSPVEPTSWTAVKAMYR